MSDGGRDAHVLDAAARELSDASAGPGQVGMGRAYRELSEAYRSGAATPGGTELTARHVAAYLAARLPATHAAAESALAALAGARPDWAPRSVLDLGAGPGTASWAACAAFGSVTTVTAVEHAPEMIRAGQRLAGRSGHDAVRGAEWVRGGVTTAPPRRADLVIASYVAGELGADELPAVVARWWEATAGELVVIEPGTPAGYGRVLAVRDQLLAAGATISAPCPSDAACPLPDGDWCHFAARVPRTALHRALKGGELGFEDEKFSYVCASRGAPAHAPGRVLRAPQVRPGHVRLTVCAAPGIRELVVSKRHKEDYRWARKAAWGDAVPEGLGG